MGSEQDGFWAINRLVENGVKTLPPDFLEYHRDTQSPCHGSCGRIAETEESQTKEAFYSVAPQSCCNSALH